MPFEYLEQSVTSDVTFRAWGHSLAELFAAAVAAVTNVMVADLETVRSRARRAVEVTGDALDMLLLRFLDEVVFLKDSDGLLLRAESSLANAAKAALALSRSRSNCCLVRSWVACCSCCNAIC